MPSTAFSVSNFDTRALTNEGALFQILANYSPAGILRKVYFTFSVKRDVLLNEIIYFQITYGCKPHLKF